VSATAVRQRQALQRLDVSAYTVPTDEPESDGTADWDSTTIVLAEVHAGDASGLGYTYGDVAVGTLVESKLAGVVRGRDAMAVPAAWEAMVEAIRNLGRPGICSMAIAAVDVALWDLKARILGLPLVTLLGAAHHDVPVYGSGGFTSYSPEELRDQLGGWVERGIRRVKMKVGREPEQDPARVAAARDAIASGAARAKLEHLVRFTRSMEKATA
jgi:L-alanine-DL-glutamate epimerase-like enolase superfamily enzyme